MNLRRTLAAFAAVAAAGLAFAGAQADKPAAAKAPIKLNLWNISQEQEDATVNGVIAKWNAANPDVQIVRDSVDVESYKLKIKTAVAANEAPDLFMSWGAGFSKPFVEAGKVLALDDHLSADIKAKAMKGSLVNSTFGGKVYGLPFQMWAGGLYCNEELFAKYGVKIPTTWDEMVSAVKAFRKAGMGALSVGVSEAWTAMFYHNVIALRTAGADQCNKALAGDAPFDSPEFLLAAQKLKELVDLNAFVDGAMGINYDEMCTLFRLGKVPMMYQGPWYAGMLEAEDSPVKGKVKIVAFPTIAGGKGKATELLGGTVDIYMVAARTKYPKESVRALEFICRELSKEMYQSGAGFPCYDDPVDESKLDRLTKQFTGLIKAADGYVLAWDTFLEGQDAQLHLDMIQEIFAGKRTPESFVQQMQTINAK